MMRELISSNDAIWLQDSDTNLMVINAVIITDRIDVPTLLLWGEHDQYLPAVYAEHWASLIPGARSVVFGACGHAPQVEKPTAFCAEVERFIGRVSA